MDSFLYNWFHKLCRPYFEDKVEDAIKLIFERWNTDIKSFIRETKSTKIAREEIDKGDKLLPGLETAPYGQTNLSSELLEIYIHAIVYAPNNSPELSRAYANRSIVLFKAQMYEDSLKDIDRALAINCPDHLKAILYSRKVKNLSALHAEESVIEAAIAEARHWLVKTNIDKDLMESKLNELIEAKFYPKPYEKLDNSLIMSDITDANETLDGASNAIALKYSEKYGRHLVATRNIKVGETLIRNKAYSFMFPLKTYTHCSNCSKRTSASVPCTHCVKVVYCDENCQKEAWSNFHDIECSIGDYIPSDEPDDVELLGLRMTVKALKEAGGTIQLLKEKLKLLDSIQDPLKQGFTGDILDNTKYAGIYTLKSDYVDKLDVQLHAQRLTMCTLMLLIWASTTDMFGKRIEKMHELINNEFAMFMGRFIMKNMRVCAQNAQQAALHDHGREIDDILMLSCLTSYINHSCEPNAYFVRSGDILAINSIETIKKGEQIFISYEFDSLMTALERQDYFKDVYNFQCDCKACQQDHNVNYNTPLLQPVIDKLQIQLHNPNCSSINVGEDQGRATTSTVSYIPILIESMNTQSEHVKPSSEIDAQKALLKVLYHSNSY